MAARAFLLCAIINPPSSTAAAVAKKARREGLGIVSIFAMAHSAVKDVSLESRRVRSVSRAFQGPLRWRGGGVSAVLTIAGTVRQNRNRACAMIATGQP